VNPILTADCVGKAFAGRRILSSASLRAVPGELRVLLGRNGIAPRRLVLTWARPKDFDDDSKHSRVTFEIAPEGKGLVRLTVTHEDLERDPDMLAGISSGWPMVLSNLKTFLETGRALPGSP